MVQWVLTDRVDLSKDAQRQQVGAPEALMLPGDNEAHRWEITVLNNGTAADLAGASVAGYFLRSDGETVAVVGSVTGNVISVVLAQECYAVEGLMRAIVRATLNGVITTVIQRLFRVQQDIGDQIIDPGEVIPDIDELLAQIAAMEAATAAANAAAAAVPSMIAPTFSTSTAYAAGDYVYYDGALYRFTADHAAGAWVGTDVTIAAIGQDVSKLKSQIDDITESTGYQYVQIPNVTKYPDERWYYPTGTGPTTSGGTGKTAIEFPCQPLSDYDICGKYAGTSEGYPIFVMDASYTILDTITTAEQVTIDGEARHTLFTTPANAAIIRYNIATDAAYDSQRVKVSSIAPKGVPDLEQAVSDLDARCDGIEDDINGIKDTVDGITENEILGYTQIADVTKYPDQRWYLQGTGPTSDGASGKTALEFACQPNTAYAICGKYAGTSKGYPIIIMDSNDNVLDTITDAEQTEYQGVARFTFFTAPANAAKVRYNVATDANFDQQLEAVYYLVPKGFSMLTPNILAGKKWAALGDSFTAYTNKTFDAGVYKTKDRVYSRLIAERNRMTLLDRFFASGRTLAYPSDGTFTNSVTCPSAACYYQNIPADVDYITIMLGINDEHHYTGGGDGEDPTGVITLGTIDDNTTATYYGAWNVVLSWLITNRPNAHIGIIVTNGLSIPEWRQAQLDIAKKYGIAYIDMNGNEHTPAMLRTVNPDIAVTVKSALIAKWAVDPTGASGAVNTHPNWQAHEYESTFIENFLRSI